MAEHRAIIIGAGRIGACYNWDQDPRYSHVGAYLALKDRVKLVAFVEPVRERADAAEKKWGLPAYTDIDNAIFVEQPDVVSVCVGPVDQIYATGKCIDQAKTVKAMWCEKPFMRGPVEMPFPTQVNFHRRADPVHRELAERIKKYGFGADLHVFAKDDIHTRCHFEDLAKFWRAELIYNAITGPCSYILSINDGIGRQDYPFLLGGVDSGECFKAMLGNLLDHMEDKTVPLWSPTR